MIAGFADLVDAVQRNCDIADARHAREVTMCTYLLGMREFYRWEHDIPYGVSPPRAEVGRWISERELHWETLVDDDYAALPVAGQRIAAFDAAAVNAALSPHGLVYGAGIGRFGKPHFFLGRLAAEDRRAGAQVLICDCEYARDISAIPAAAQGETIIVRREALRQWLWQRAEGWAVKRQPGAMARVLAAHDFDAEPAAAIERLLDAETETLALHETGEVLAGRQLGPAWHDRLAQAGSRHAELLLRAVRDHLADSLVTLPTLIERGVRPSIDLWFASLDGLRRELVPGLVAAYEGAQNSSRGDAAVVPASALAGAPEHWLGVARSLMDEDDAALAALAARPQPIAR